MEREKNKEFIWRKRRIKKLYGERKEEISYMEKEKKQKRRKIK